MEKEYPTKIYEFDVTIENQGAKEKEYAHFYNEKELGMQRKMKIEINFHKSGAFAYGNRYAMTVTIDDNQANSEIYDIRYDTRFSVDKARDYAIDFIKDNWSGKQGSWTAIEIKEIIKEEEKVSEEVELDER